MFIKYPKIYRLGKEENDDILKQEVVIQEKLDGANTSIWIGEAISQTMDWLIENEVDFDELHMRNPGDQRKDSVVKREMFDEFIKDKYNVLFVVDDRDQVVEMWRSMGLTCLQVNYGDF